MRKHYDYHIAGSAAEGQSWSVEGYVEGEFDAVFNIVCKDAFDKLTGGKAVYGDPGKGCRGPYEINQVIINRVRKN